MALEEVQKLWGEARTTLGADGVDWVEAGQDGFAWLVLAAPDLWMDVAWTVAVCHDRRHTFLYRSFIYALASCLLFSYAGGLTSRLLIGETPGVFASNVSLLASALTWFLVFFTPLHHLYSFPPLKILFVMGQAICWQRCVCSAVELGIARFPASFVTPILLAIVAGSAGGVMMNLEKRFFGRDGGTSTLGIKLSFLVGVIYYSQHPAALSRRLLAPSMTLDQARVLVGAVLVGWSVLAELWRPINPSGFVEAIFGFVFLNKEQYSAWADQPLAIKVPSKQDTAGKRPVRSSNKEKERGKEEMEVINADGVASPISLRNRKKQK